MSEYCPYTYGGHPTKLKYPETWQMPSEKVRDLRWQALRKAMRKRNLDFLIVTYHPPERRRMCRSGRPAAFMRAWTSSMLYATRW